LPKSFVPPPADTPDAPPSLVGVVDPDPSIRRRVANLLRSIGAEVAEYATAAEFLQMLPAGVPVFLIAATQLSNLSGLALLQELRARGLDIPVILISHEPDIFGAVTAIRAGALDFIEPFDLERTLPNQVTPFLHRNQRRPTHRA
jgi:FixJ family two-component response regulator